MKKELGDLSDSTSSPELTGATEELARTRLARRALIRGGAISLAGALSARFPAKAFAQGNGTPFQSQEMPFIEGMVFGKGVNVVDGKPIGFAVVPGDPEVAAEGLEVSFRFERQDSQEELFKAIGIDIEASGHYSFFSGSATFEFTNQLRMSRQSTHLLAQVTVRQTAKTLAHARLTPDALALLKVLTPGEFRDKFGDGFIDTIWTGGEYYAVYSIFSDSLDLQTNTAASLKLDFDNGLAGGGVDIHISERTNELLKNCALSILTYQRGGDAQGALPAIDPVTIMKRVIDFPKIVVQNPKPYKVTVTGYIALPEFRFPPDVNRELRQSALKEYAHNRLFLQEKREDVAEQLAHREAFVNVPPVRVLNGWSEDLTTKLNKLNSRAVTCAETGDCPLEPFQLPDGYQDPVRPDVVVLFANENFTGKAWLLKQKGWFDWDTPAMAWRNEGNHMLSMKVPAGLIVRSYSELNFQGVHIDITESLPTLGAWQDKAKSMVIYGTGNPEPRVEHVVIFRDSNYQKDGIPRAGIICPVSDSFNMDPPVPGSYDRVPFRSIRVPKGLKVSIWRHAGFKGDNGAAEGHFVTFEDVPLMEPIWGSFDAESMIITRFP